jgi:hypothetical protein
LANRFYDFLILIPLFRNSKPFQNLTASYVIQRTLGFDAALEELGDHPLAASVRAELKNNDSPKFYNFSGWREYRPGSMWPQNFVIGKFELKVNETTGEVQIAARSAGNHPRKFSAENYSQVSGGLGKIYYVTYDDVDYEKFAATYAYDWPKIQDWWRKDFLKENLPKPVVSATTVTKLRSAFVNPEGTRLVLLSVLPAELVTEAGAPKLFTVEWTFEHPDARNLEAIVGIWEKTATRLPESTHFSFSGSVKEIKKMWLSVNPGDVVNGGSKKMHVVDEVMFNSGIKIEPLDAPLLVIGNNGTAFPTPIFSEPDLSSGVSFVLHNNIWDTNYVMWYPFVEGDASITFKFKVHL